jgi:hypothetical protein
MHDANGSKLNVGDKVMIPCEITQLHGGEDYCNVDMKTTIGRRPDGEKEQICAINTGCMVKVCGGYVTLNI